MAPTGQTLSTTAYAILGLLHGGALTSRALMAEYRRCFGECWSKTDALVYEETRRLCRLHYLSRSGTGMSRSYAITPTGRESLRAWHRRRPDTPRVDIEAALRVVLASSADDDDVRRSLEELETWATARRARLTERATTGDRCDDPHAIADELFESIYRVVVEWTRHATTALPARGDDAAEDERLTDTA